MFNLWFSAELCARTLLDLDSCNLIPLTSLAPANHWKVKKPRREDSRFSKSAIQGDGELEFINKIIKIGNTIMMIPRI